MKHVITEMVRELIGVFDKNIEIYENTPGEAFAIREKLMNVLGATHMIIKVGSDEGLTDEDLDPFVVVYQSMMSILNRIDLKKAKEMEKIEKVYINVGE